MRASCCFAIDPHRRPFAWEGGRPQATGKFQAGVTAAPVNGICSCSGIVVAGTSRSPK